MEAFNKQVKANQSFMAALTAARKAQTAAETEARKNRDKNKLEAKDINPARKTIDTVLTRVASGIFRDGVGISNKARGYKETLTAEYIKKLSELTPSEATNWLTARVLKDSPNFKKLVD